MLALALLLMTTSKTSLLGLMMVVGSAVFVALVRRGPALGVVMNAVIDAIAEYGVTHIEMPATPEKVWRAIQGA